MPSARTKDNTEVFWILVVSGLMMIWGGVGYFTGPGIFGYIMDFIAEVFLDNNPILRANVLLIVWIFTFFGAWGGFSVIFGAILIYFGHTTLGKLIVSLGAGMGLITLVLIIVVAFYFGLFAVLGLIWLVSHSIGLLGVLLSIYGRLKVK